MDWGNVTAEDLIDALREVDWSSPPRPFSEFFSRFTFPRSSAKWTGRRRAPAIWIKQLNAPLEEIDPEIADIIEHEKARQWKGLELIPSENFTSLSVMQAVGSVMTNKYSEGYPGARYYGGNEYIDMAKSLCQKRALKAFNLDPAKWGDVNIESPPSMHPCKRICDITGFEAPYHDPRTKLRYANTDVFKRVRSLPNEYVQRYLELRNAAVVLK